MKGRVFPLFALAAVLGAAPAWPGPPPDGKPAGPPASAPAPAAVPASTPASPLSAEERDWIDDKVAPLATPQEAALFRSLPTESARTAFREQFWAIREDKSAPAPYGPGFHGRYQDRYDAAKAEFDGVRGDAGRVVLARGVPLSRVTVNCPSLLRPVEIWKLPPTEAPSEAGTNDVIFYRDSEGSPLRLWTPQVGPDALLLPSVAMSDRTGAGAASLLTGGCGGFTVNATSCPEICDLARLMQRLTMASTAIETLAGFTHFPPPPPFDWNSWIAKYGGAALTAAQEARLVAESPKPSAPAAPPSRLTRKERNALAKALPEKYRDWLEGVDLIITDEERDVFLQIKDDLDRDRFIDEFWRRRSIDKDGLRTNFRAQYESRVTYARQTFKSLSSDAAKIYILNGPPDAIIPVDCGDLYVPIQIWYYERVEALKSKLYLVLYRPYGMMDWTLWTPIDGVKKLAAGEMTMNLNNAAQSCFDAQTLAQAVNAETAILGPGASGMAAVAKLFAPPAVETEGVNRFLGMTTQLTPGAAAIPIQWSSVFPARHGGKLAVDISILVPRRDLAIRSLGKEKFYDVDLVGDVIDNDHLLENFKYRFDIPIDEVGEEQLPLTLRRYLYPGAYRLRLKVADANHSAEGRATGPLVVPDAPQAPAAYLAALHSLPAGAVPDTDTPPSSISILPPVRDILTGLQRFETRESGGIRSVDFFLDGTKSITRTRPPFDADLNLGPLPRKHTIRVVGYDARGRDVGEDELTINAGAESFRVKIVSPAKGVKVSGATEVIADATAPEGHHIQKMEFYSNETKIATLFQPPWQQIVPVRKTSSLGYLRVVATLDDGLVAEDVHYVNAPEYVSNVNVDAVELYTSVMEHNHPVTGLTEKSFRIFEDGAPQQIARFEQVTNLPLSIGIAIDTSASMIENLPEAEKAALAFLEGVLTPKDRAFTLSFDDAPYMLCRLTSDRSMLESSFAGLRAEGSTALYDAVVYALYQFQGVKGKKMLIVLTDGKDNSSRYDFDTLLDYVRQAGVSIYGIGLNISSTDVGVKAKLARMADASGGRTFFIKDVRSLPSIYKQIDEELRTQYLLTYYSSNGSDNDKWRSVAVKMTPSSLKARTISGYYP